VKVLIACEYSGRVRDAFNALGHDAMICDLLESERAMAFQWGSYSSVSLGQGGN